MIFELRIRDLAIIDRLDLTFGPGFNVLTGETGAGKSIIIDAVNLLLGDRASADVVRAGAERTEIEGTFQLGPPAAARVMPLLAEHSLEGDPPERRDRTGCSILLVLAREVRANGRSVARVNGRAVTTALLGEIGGLLVDVHGQGEHLSLLREREHIGLLDRYAGLGAQADAVAALVRRVRAVRRELEGLRQDERERARRIDLLTYQIEEIRSAQLAPGEADDLEGERRRLANAEQLATLSNEAELLLAGGDDDRAGALDALGTAAQAMSRLARLDPGAAPLVEQLGEATALLDDLARELARYRDGIEFNPRRLQQVEERVHLIHGLQRKYGDTITEVLAYGERAAAELEHISHAEERIAGLEGEEAELLAEVGRRGAALSAARRAAGERMARAIEAELADLQMAKARFAVERHLDGGRGRRSRGCRRRGAGQPTTGTLCLRCPRAGHRRLPRLGQSGRAAQAVGESGFRRRDLAADARAQDGARPRRRDPHADLRRDRPGDRRPRGRDGGAEAVGLDQGTGIGQGTGVGGRRGAEEPRSRGTGGPGCRGEDEQWKMGHRPSAISHRHQPSAISRSRPPGVVHHPPAATGGLRRRALSRIEARHRRAHGDRCPCAVG